MFNEDNDLDKKWGGISAILNLIAPFWTLLYILMLFTKATTKNWGEICNILNFIVNFNVFNEDNDLEKKWGGISAILNLVVNFKIFNEEQDLEKRIAEVYVLF